MKRYFYTSIEIDKRNGRKIYGKVYKLTKGDLKLITEYSCSTASYRGTIHEVFNALMNCGEINKKWYKSSESDWSSGGYFEGEVKNHFSIKAL